ncbi:hypothetical protein EAF04_004746 [Stromatinia cepivora]|nr:hypothetical protein EAF04_004746 [Stromatinia cepivora]
MAGVAALPETLTIVPMAMILGIIAAKTGTYRWGLWFGWAMTAFGCGMLYLLDVGTPVVAWVFLMLGSGIGIGLLYPAMSLAIQASTPPEDAATAAGLFTFFRAFGQTVGVAIGGVIFQNRMLSELRAIPDFTILAAQFGYTLEKAVVDAVALIPLINALPPDTSEVVEFRLVSAKSIKTIWIVMCIFAVSGFIASCFVKGYDLDQALVTDQGFAIGVKKVDPEKLEIDTKANDLEKVELSAEQKVIDSCHSKNVSDEKEINNVSEWGKSDLFGNRKSAVRDGLEKLKLSARGESEYSTMSKKDSCLMFGKDY